MLAAFASTVLARGDREVLEGQRHRNKEKERKGVREGRQESYEAQSRTKDQLLFRPALYHAPDLVLLDGEHLLSSERLDVDKGEAGGEQWEGDGRGPRLLAEGQHEGEDGEADEGVPRVEGALEEVVHGRQQRAGGREPLDFGACARAQQGDEETRRGDAGGSEEGA